MVKTKTSHKKTSRAELIEEISRELRHLRSIVRETGENFILRREGAIETVVSNLSIVPPSTLKAVTESLRHDLLNLKVKSEKGRLKDLKSLDQLIQKLAEQVIATQDKAKPLRK